MAGTAKLTQKEVEDILYSIYKEEVWPSGEGQRSKELAWAAIAKAFAPPDSSTSGRPVALTAARAWRTSTLDGKRKQAQQLLRWLLRGAKGWDVPQAAAAQRIEAVLQAERAAQQQRGQGSAAQQATATTVPLTAASSVASASGACGAQQQALAAASQLPLPMAAQPPAQQQAWQQQQQGEAHSSQPPAAAWALPQHQQCWQQQQQHPAGPLVVTSPDVLSRKSEQLHVSLWASRVQQGAAPAVPAGVEVQVEVTNITLAPLAVRLTVHSDPHAVRVERARTPVAVLQPHRRESHSVAVTAAAPGPLAPQLLTLAVELGGLGASEIKFWACEREPYLQLFD